MSWQLRRMVQSQRPINYAGAKPHITNCGNQTGFPGITMHYLATKLCPRRGFLLSEFKGKFKLWCVTIYSDDPQLYQAHLVHQFKRSCEEIESEFSFVCCHDKKFTKSGIELLQQFVSLKSDDGIKLREAYFYEQKRPCSPIKGQTELKNYQTNISPAVQKSVGGFTLEPRVHFKCT